MKDKTPVIGTVIDVVADAINRGLDKCGPGEWEWLEWVAVQIGDGLLEVNPDFDREVFINRCFR